MAIVAALFLPALSFINGRKFEGSVLQITSILNMAREEARSKNTYTWVLFYPNTASAQLTVVAIESKDGTDPIAWGTYAGTVPDSTIGLLAPPLTLSQINLAAVGALDSQISSLPTPTASSSNDLNTEMSVQVNVPVKGTVTFNKAIRYLPSNGAGNNISVATDPAAKFIELDLQPMRGASLDAKNVAVVRIDKASAALQLYRP